jgi:LysM repeat protein
VVAIEEHVSAGATLREYTVKKGDALALIAKRECGSEKAVKAIMTLNQLKDGNVLKIGQKLKLPARGQ